jgi:two-component system OmpR family sensor kinase
VQPKAKTNPAAIVPRLRNWLLNTVSIRLRLALWYGALLTVTLTLFSLIAMAVLQYQLQSSLDASLQSDAQLVARTLQNELAATSTAPATPSPSVTPAPTVAPTATVQPTATAQSGTTPTAGETPTSTPTPVPTPDPAQSSKIQHQLLLSSDARDLLGRFDLTFEVINKSGKVAYYAPNISPENNGSGLPLNASAVQTAITTGVCQLYTRPSSATLLRVLIFPVVFPAAGTANTQPHTASTVCSGADGGQIVGAIVIARAADDIGRTLDTLRRILFVGAIVAVIFASLGGWLIAGSGLRPIAVVTSTAKAIAMNAQGAGLGRRVDYHGPRDEVGALAETFDQMLAALERVSVAQRRFAADASHELRAPLTTIKGSLDLLRRARDLDPEERAAAIEDAYAEAERMSGLVNDLLLLARADAAGASGRHAALLDDQMRGRRELVELDQLVMDIFRHGQAQLQARRKGSKIQLSVGALEPVAAMADPSQMRQVMLILLDNAIKYMPGSGRIRLSVTARGNRAALSVADTGMGIEPEALPHIFERFYRGDQARERDQLGSGLGLAIAQWIATTHGGEITVQSELGKGSVFTLLLPMARRPGETGSMKRPAVPQRRRAKATASVVGMVGMVARLASNVSRPRMGLGASRMDRADPKQSDDPARSSDNQPSPRTGRRDRRDRR